MGTENAATSAARHWANTNGRSFMEYVVVEESVSRENRKGGGLQPDYEGKKERGKTLDT